MFLRKLFGNNTKEMEDTPNKWQLKLHLAQINPEADLDLTNCAIKCLPKGIYGQCRIYRKNRLLLSDNYLSTLPDDNDNNLSNLIDLCIYLDLSRNQLKFLPINLGNLTNLKELNLSHNMINCIPESFRSMKSLETINLSHNQLNKFPRVLTDIKSLKHIDVSYNQLISHLPSSICNLIKLEKLITDGTVINHPPRRICEQGIESLYKFFNHDQLVDEKIAAIESCSTSNQFTPISKTSSEDLLQSYLARKDDRRKQLIEFEKGLLIDNKSIEATNRKMIDKKSEILMKIKQDQLMLDKSLETLLTRKSDDKLSIINALTLVEDHSSQLVDQLASLPSRSKSNDHGNISESITNNQDHLMDTLENRLRQLMISKDLKKESIQSELIKEDESLYQAICHFAEMKNTQELILSEQIGLIEHELYYLTKAEIQQSNNKVDRQMTKIHRQRVALASLLKDLTNQRNQFRYNRKSNSTILSSLIEKVTSSIFNDQFNQENDTDPENIDPHLNQLSDDLDPSLRQLYSHLFTNCSISLQQLADSSDDQLKSFGIKEEHILVIRKHINLNLPTEQLNSPSAPQLDEINPQPSAPPMKLYQLIECVICLDQQAKIILIPCGHVCTCYDCSMSLRLCPLCRSEIAEKIKSN